MIVFIFIILLFLVLAYKRPDLVFWLAVTIFLDPGGYFRLYIFKRSFIGGFHFTDLTFILLLIPLLSPKIKIASYFKHSDNKWIFNYLLFFAIFYHVIIYGFVSTGVNVESLLSLLQYERLTIWGFIAIIPAYIFTRRNYQLLAKFALISSLVLAILYLIYLITGLPVMPIGTFERGLGITATRIAMRSYGYANWFVYIALIILIFKFKIPRKNWVYFIGLIFFLAVVLTLTRRSIMFLIYTCILIYVFHQHFSRSLIISARLGKLILAVVVALLILYIFAPNYIKYSIAIVDNTIDMVFPSESSIKQDDGRLQYDIPQHISRFKESPLFGYGYDPLWYSNKEAEGGLSANDVPLTAALGMFGILGLFLFSIYYFKIFAILYRSYKVLRFSYRIQMAKNNAVIFIIGFVLFVNFIAKFTMNIMGYFGDIISGEKRVSQMLFIGIFLAARDIFLYKLRNREDLRSNALHESTA